MDAPPVGAAAPGPKVAPVAAGDAGWSPAVEPVKAAESAAGAGQAEVGDWALPEGLTRPSPSGAYRNADETDSRRERWAGPAGPGLAETPRVRSWAPRSHQTANAKHRPVSKHRLSRRPAGRFGQTPPRTAALPGSGGSCPGVVDWPRWGRARRRTCRIAPSSPACVQLQVDDSQYISGPESSCWMPPKKWAML